MRDDNTPTVTARRRKPTAHQRLRLEKAKELKKRNALTEKKREEKKQKAGETDPAKVVQISRLPNLKKNTLAAPSKPPAKFRKRQVHKQWLPTHIYHARRAHMTPPKEPLWRFAIPLTPTEKCYRSTHRAATLRGCVVWDMSYMGTIGVEGVEASVVGLLRGVGVEERALLGTREVKWRKGTRWWEGWIRERDADKRWIAKVGIAWCPEELYGDTALEGGEGASAGKQGKATSNETGDVVMEGTEPCVKPPAAQGKKKLKRKLLIRVHPSVFFQVWNEVLKVAKIQRPQCLIEDLRFEIGSIEVVGPGSTEALIGALHPIIASTPGTEVNAEDGVEAGWEDLDNPEKVWPQLATVSNPSSLPANALLGFNISDPRLQHPPKTVRHAGLHDDSLLELLSSWPPDQTQTPPDIFNRTKRLTASRLLASQKAVNRRKGDALPGSYPDSSPKDPKIPILLFVSHSSTTAGQGSWTLLLPWDCVLPVWYTLMHYPLSSGGNPRFGGLHEHRQVLFEQSMPWFSADFPGTKAGFEWEVLEREKRKQEWERKPKGRRTEWGSVNLGGGRKGEIGMGWACDWERLFRGPPATEPDQRASETPKDTAEKPTTADDLRSQRSTSPDLDSSNPQEASPPEPPSLSITHLHNPLTALPPIPPTALAPIHLTLLVSGHPSRTARIYRLPTTDPALRTAWLALAYPANKQSKHNKANRPAPRPAPPPPRTAPAHTERAHLARSLLSSADPSSSSTPLLIPGPPKPGDATYPHVPDEVDLIGFVTTGNYHLGEGQCIAVGNVAVARVVGGAEEGGVVAKGGLCVVRESGVGVGRMARWRFL